ncbi:Autoinducer 2 (AI-2) kinase LsrK [Klebsiella pneumoniae]|uniref:Autoinducer 2 (AI-2) kinase LsrK n=1 Tax=Klebsiella pneumoniae TaxID=573 RepID=A0A2X3FD80_KLEPN|nr:Autoinducer 2 (AI-2) kinase LsrK [Klebsiella pneumoniae]
MRWFRDAFCAEEKLIAERLGVDAYSLLEEMASRVPAGSHGVMPIFSDAMHFKQWYHAAPSFINLSIDPEKCNKATLFRALEENAAIVSACNLAQISQFSGVTFESLVFAGGGSKGALWSQILSDVTGLPVRVPVVREATALGCAIRRRNRRRIVWRYGQHRRTVSELAPRVHPKSAASRAVSGDDEQVADGVRRSAWPCR